MAHENHRPLYKKIAAALAVMTLIEVFLPDLYPTISKASVVSALVVLAVAKAGLVAIFFMHLKYETALLRRAVYYCLALPAVYAVILITEGYWRMAL